MMWSEHRRYYNGKLATVQRISGNEITVAMKDSGTELLLEKSGRTSATS